MNRTLVRILALVLCAVMLLGLIPAIAMAAETEETTVEVNKVDLMTVDGQIQPVYSTYTKELSEPTCEEEVQPTLSFGAANAVTQYGNSYYFETFKDLKNLVAQSFDTQSWAVYEGTGDLVISEDLTFPYNLGLTMNGKNLIIQKGASLTTGTSAYFDLANVTVNGTLNVNYITNVYGKLTVNGKVNIPNSVVYLRSGGTVSGLNNVIRGWNEAIRYYWDVRTVSDLEDAIFAAKNTGDGLSHGVNMRVDGTLTLDKSLTLPKNMYDLAIWGEGTLVIPKGVTFTNNAYMMYLSCNTQVKGKFVNNGTIQFNSPATLTVTGTYSGKGQLKVYNQNGETKLSQIVKKLDLDAYIVQEHTYNNGWSHYWEVLDPNYVTQLGTPRNLKWHKRVAGKSDGTIYLDDFMGGAAWTAAKPLGKGEFLQFIVRLYKDGQQINEYWTGNSYDYFDQTLYCSADGLTLSLKDLESGTYYFTVQAYTEEPGYCSSEIAVSGTWKYTKPSAKVKAPTSLSWNGPMAKWNKVSGAERYLYEFYYSPTKSGTPVSIGWSWAYTNSQEIYRYMLEQNGPGYYSFKARTLSEDITEKRHSDWSDLSPAYYYSGKAKPSAPKLMSYVDEATGDPVVYWNRVPGANKYRIYRSTSKDGTYKSIGVMDSGMNMYGQYGWTDDTAKTGTKYYYKVRAYSYTDVISSYSSAVALRATLARPKVTVTGDSSTGKPVLQWKEVKGAEKYYVYRATSKTGDYARIGSTTSEKYTDKTAKAGKTYYYKVKAIDDNSAANSAFSAVKSRMCDLKRPDVSIKLTSGGDPYLKWSEISGAEKYVVYRATSKTGTYKKIATVTAEKYTDKSVSAGKTYYYKVKALHAKSGANSAYSAIDSIKAK